MQAQFMHAFLIYAYHDSIIAMEGLLPIHHLQ